MIRTHKNIAIIGAGLAGATAAHALGKAGHDVTVFEKSRGTGGRLATRRSDVGAFDHGAPVAEGDGAFDAAIADLAAEKVSGGWRGTPGMSSLVKPWLDGVDVQGGRRIVGLTRETQWHMRDETGATHGGFDHVISAIPAPQFADLWPDAAAQLTSVQMSPCWTLMARWPEIAGGPRPSPIFGSVVPQRAGGWVAHATRDWTEGHLELDHDAVIHHLVPRLMEALDQTQRPEHVAAHRWRFARVAAPLGRPFLDLGNGLIAGGDWALGEKAGDAWNSGMAMASHVRDV